MQFHYLSVIQSKMKHYTWKRNYRREAGSWSLLLFQFRESFAPLSKHVGVHMWTPCIGHFGKLASTYSIIGKKKKKRNGIRKEFIDTWNINSKDCKCCIVVIKWVVPLVWHPDAVLPRFLEKFVHLEKLNQSFYRIFDLSSHVVLMHDETISKQ